MKKEIAIKGAIFDIDGTLLDSMPIWQDACSRYLISIGVTPEPNLSSIVFSMTLNEGVSYAKEHYNLSYTEDEIKEGVIELIKNFYYKEALLKSGVFELVKKLYESGIPMVLATTGDEDLATHALERNGILKFYEKLLTCNSMNTSKRETKIFLECKNIIENKLQTQLDTSEIIVFEDSLTAVKTTKSAGFMVVGIKDASGTDMWEGLSQEADILVDELDELLVNKNSDNEVMLTLKKNECICPCCEKYYFSSPSDFEICPICNWENDGVQRKDPNYQGGANTLCLNDARIKYQENK